MITICHVASGDNIVMIVMSLEHIGQNATMTVYETNKRLFMKLLQSVGLGS